MKLFRLSQLISATLSSIFLSSSYSADHLIDQTKKIPPVVHLYSNQSIPTNFKEWEFVEFMAGKGGGTGVHVYHDKQSDAKYTIKEPLHLNHLLEEALSKALYRSLGFNAPLFIVIDRTTNLWPQAWKDKFANATHLLISQFIEEAQERSRANEEKREKIYRWIDVLLGNFDLAGHNYVIGIDGQIWPIDFGCSLRFGASGQVKGLVGLWGYFWPKVWPKDMVVKDPTAEEIHVFKSRLTAFFETLIDFHRQWSITDFPNLWNIMSSRIHSFLHTYDPDAPQYWADRPAIEEQVSGGVLLVCDVDGIPHALQAKRANSWADVGGGAIANDQTISRVAWREAIEELGGFLQLDYKTLVSSPFIEHYGDVLYRMYLLRVPTIDIAQLKSHVASTNNPYKKEHDDYRLVPLELSATLPDLYEPMRALLSTNHARNVLRNFRSGHNLATVKRGGNFVGAKRLGDYTFQTLTVDLLPTNIWDGKVAFAREIRLRQRLKIVPHITPINPPYPHTATQGMTRALLFKFRNERDSNDRPILTFEDLLLRKSSYFKANPNKLPACMPIIQNITNTETEYPNHFMNLHGSTGHFALLWVIGSILRDTLFLDTNLTVRTLRLYENVFENIHTFNDHIQALPEGMNSDYAPGAQSRVISTNLSFLGSLGRDSSETINFFFGNKYARSGDDPRGLLSKFLHIVLRLPTMAVNQFLASLEPHVLTLDTVGALWQCFVPSDLAEYYTRLTFPGGKKALFKGQESDETVFNSTVPFLNILRRMPETIVDALQEDTAQGFDFINTQGRALLHPDFLYGAQALNVHSKLYFADGQPAVALYTAVKQKFMRLIYPHLHLASITQAYTVAPRMLQLYNLISGRPLDKTDPRLVELMDLAAKGEPSKDPFWGVDNNPGTIHYEGIGEELNDIILAKLADKNTASLEKVDSLSLKRIRALDQSPMLQAISEELARKLPNYTQEQWERVLKSLRDRFYRIQAFLASESLRQPDQSIFDLAYLLSVNQEDPNFERLKHVIQCKVVRPVLCGSNPERMNRNIGRVLATFYKWDKKRRSILRGLFSTGFILCDGKQDNTGVLDIKEQFAPEEIMDALTMLQEFPILIESEINPSSWVFLVNDILAKGVAESRTALQKIYGDLQIQRPPNSSNLSSLYEIKNAIGDQWPKVVKDFNRLLSRYTADDSDIASGLRLTWTVDSKKIENLLSMLEREGILKSGLNDGIFYFLIALSALMDPEAAISQVKSMHLDMLNLVNLQRIMRPESLDTLAQLARMQVPLDQFDISGLMVTLEQLQKLSSATRKECLQLISKIAQLRGSTLQPYHIAEVVHHASKNPTRIADLEVLTSRFVEYFWYGNTDREYELAMKMDKTSFQKLKLFHHFGFSLQACEDQKRDVNDICSFIERNLTLFTNNVESIRSIVEATMTPCHILGKSEEVYEDWFNMVCPFLDGKHHSNEAMKSLADFCKHRGNPQFKVLIPHILQLSIPFKQMMDALSSRELCGTFLKPELYSTLDQFSRNIAQYQMSKSLLSLEQMRERYNQYFDILKISDKPGVSADFGLKCLNLACEVAQHNPSLLPQIAKSLEAAAEEVRSDSRVDILKVFDTLQTKLHSP